MAYYQTIRLLVYQLPNTTKNLNNEMNKVKLTCKSKYLTVSSNTVKIRERDSIALRPKNTETDAFGVAWRGETAA